MATIIYCHQGCEPEQIKALFEQRHKKCGRPDQRYLGYDWAGTIIIREQDTTLAEILKNPAPDTYLIIKSIRQIPIPVAQLVQLIRQNAHLILGVVMLDEDVDISPNTREGQALLKVIEASSVVPVAPSVIRQQNQIKPKGFGIAPVAEETVKAIRKDRRNGELLTALAGRYRLSVPTVSKYTKDIPFYRPRRRKKEDEEKPKEILKYKTPKSVMPGSVMEKMLTEFVTSQRKPATRATYYYALKHVFDFARQSCVCELQEPYEVTYEHVMKYLHHQEETGATPRRVRTYLDILKAFTGFCISRGAIGSSWIPQIKGPVVQKTNVTANPMTAQALAEVITVAYANAAAAETNKQKKITARTALAVHLLASVGMRLGGLLSLRIRDIRRHGHLTYLSMFAKSTADRFEVSIDPEAAARLQHYITNYLPFAQEGDYVFQSPLSRAEPITQTEMRRNLKEVIAKAGLPIKGKDKITTHSFRVTWATLAYKNNMQPREIQLRLNHRTPTQTFAYLKLDNREVEAPWVPKGLPPLPVLTPEGANL